MSNHRMRDAEYAAAVRASGGGESATLAKLRDDLEAAKRVMAKYPELADSTRRKADAIASEIAKLEGDN